jgi:hypothetical protein
MRGRTGFAAIAGGFAVLLVTTACAGSASAVTILHVHDFAGYQTYKTGSTTASMTFKVPAVTCGAAATGIQPGLEATVAGNRTAPAYLYAATLQMMCANGALSVTEAMFASGAETDYSDAVATGDSITATLTISTSGSVVTLQDTTAGHAFKLTDSGAESYATGEYLGVAGAPLGAQQLIPAPTFTPVNFTLVKVGGKNLSQAVPQTALEYGSPSACLVYTIPTAVVTQQNFSVEAPPVNITGFSPTIEPAGKVVTIDGYGFTSKSTVTFMGGAAASHPTLVSPTELRATVPDAATPGPITVANAKNPSGTITDLCSFDPQPVITKLTSTSGPTGKAITIDGGGFTNVGSLTIGGYPFTTFTVVNPTRINATIPNGALSGDIAVNSEWGDYTTTSPFTVTLSITGFSPLSGPAGTTVTISGVGFIRTSKVKFGTVAATKTTFVSSTELTTTVPPKFTSGQISVTNSSAPAGTATSVGTFN